jgi:KaiC/GvpD/RAD55 family RecA-like ATPase
MNEFGWDINQFVKSGNWKFLKIKENGSLTDQVISEMKQNRTVVIDSLSELLLTHNEKEAINLLTTMAHQNKDGKEFHMLLLTSGMQNQQIETTMEHFSEGVIVFNTTWTKDSTLRHILIKKMRGITVPIRMLQYNLGKKGFIIETATRIN